MLTTGYYRGLFLTVLFGVFSVLAGYPKEAPPLKVRALKASVNLRARPALTAEVVGQAAVGQELTAKSLDTEWVEVVVPANIDFWVLGDYLKEGVVVCRQRVNVRAGPGINFSTVGQLDNAAKAEVRGSHGEWIKIAPPENCSLWVSRSLVEVAPARPPPVEPPKPPGVAPAAALPPAAESDKPLPPAQDKRETPVVAATAAPPAEPEKPAPVEPPKPLPQESAPAVAAPVSVRAPAPAPAPAAIPPKAPSAPPKDLDLDADLAQGQWKEYAGVLRTRNFLARSPSDFRLVAKDKDGHSHTLCFIKGNRAQLDALLFRELVVQGRQYWVKRQRCPVLVPERFILK